MLLKLPNSLLKSLWGHLLLVGSHLNNTALNAKYFDFLHFVFICFILFLNHIKTAYLAIDFRFLGRLYWYVKSCNKHPKNVWPKILQGVVLLKSCIKCDKSWLLRVQAFFNKNNLNMSVFWSSL